jgi:hypothetical protein
MRHAYAPRVAVTGREFGRVTNRFAHIGGADKQLPCSAADLRAWNPVLDFITIRLGTEAFFFASR